MLFDLVSFQVHGGIEDDELLLHALGVGAWKVIPVEVLLQRVVVNKVSRVVSTGMPVAQVAALVSISTVSEQLILAIESLSAKATLRMTLKTTLVDSSWVVVTLPLVFPKLLLGEQLVLVRENLLIPGTQVAHDLLMCSPYVSMQIWPSQTCNIAARVWTVVPKQNHCVLEDLLLLVADTHVIVPEMKVRWYIFLELLLRFVCEDHRCCLCTAMRASLRLVQRSQSQRANMACPVIAWRNTVVVDI